MVLKFCRILTKRWKLKFTKFWLLIFTFREVTLEKLEKGKRGSFYYLWLFLQLYIICSMKKWLDSTKTIPPYPFPESIASKVGVNASVISFFCMLCPDKNSKQMKFIIFLLLETYGLFLSLFAQRFLTVPQLNLRSCQKLAQMQTTMLDLPILNGHWTVFHGRSHLDLLMVLLFVLYSILLISQISFELPSHVVVWWINGVAADADFCHSSLVLVFE